MPPPRRRPAPIRAEVRSVVRLSPHLVRITVGGDDLTTFTWPGPAGHLKLIIPEAGATDGVLPVPDADGTVAFGGGGPLTMRTYTARSFDADAAELTLDLVLHGAGPAAAWAAAAAPGDRLAVSRSRGAGFTVDPDADWLLVAGDSSALPAIATIAETLQRPATVIVEVDDPADRLELAVPVQWLVREPTEAPADALGRAVAAFDLPAGRGQVWLATEATAVRAIRAQLMERGLGREQLTTRGYWRAGDANHPDHDHGED